MVASVVATAGLDTLSEDDLELVFHKVYDSFMEAVDAIDNGVSQYDTDALARYESSTDLGARVGRCNADWFEKMPDQDKNFFKAVKLAGAELDDCIVRVVRSWLPARAIVARAFNARSEDHGSGQIMVMREWAPWKDHLYDLEAEAGANAAADGAASRRTQGAVRRVPGHDWQVVALAVRARREGELREQTPAAAGVARRAGRGAVQVDGD